MLPRFSRTSVAALRVPRTTIGEIIRWASLGGAKMMHNDDRRAAQPEGDNVAWGTGPFRGDRSCEFKAHHIYYATPRISSMAGQKECPIDCLRKAQEGYQEASTISLCVSIATEHKSKTTSRKTWKVLLYTSWALGNDTVKWSKGYLMIEGLSYNVAPSRDPKASLIQLGDLELSIEWVTSLKKSNTRVKLQCLRIWLCHIVTQYILRAFITTIGLPSVLSYWRFFAIVFHSSIYFDWILNIVFCHSFVLNFEAR